VILKLLLWHTWNTYWNIQTENFDLFMEMSNLKRKLELVVDQTIEQDWLQQVNHEDDALSSKKLMEKLL